MSTAIHRHDMSDEVWALLEPHLPGQRGQWGGIAQDNRRFINAVFWILRTGAPWRDLPTEYGNWNSVAKRFRRWVEQGVWEATLECIIDDPDYEWLMIDASHIKVHPHAAGAVGAGIAGSDRLEHKVRRGFSGQETLHKMTGRAGHVAGKEMPRRAMILAAVHPADIRARIQAAGRMRGKSRQPAAAIQIRLAEHPGELRADR